MLNAGAHAAGNIRRRRYYRAMLNMISGATPRLRAMLLVVSVLAAGCAQIRPAPPVAPAPVARYEPVTTQDPATVAELRAAPPPATPDIGNGGKPSADEQLLNARGYARIGDGFIPPEAGDARAWAQQQGQRIGADKILMYAPAAG